MNISRQMLFPIGAALLCLSASASAQRGGRGGGGGGMRGGGGMASRGGARSSVTLPAGGGRSNYNGNVDRLNVSRPNGNMNGGYRSNVDIDRGDVNVRRPIYVNDAENGNYYNRGLTRGAAVATAAVMTADAIGSVVYGLPSSCTMVVVGSVTYQQCGSTWYRPQFAGTTTAYVVVSAPR